MIKKKCFCYKKSFALIFAHQLYVYYVCSATTHYVLTSLFVCLFVYFLFSIVLSVLLRLAASDFHLHLIAMYCRRWYNVNVKTGRYLICSACDAILE